MITSRNLRFASKNIGKLAVTIAFSTFVTHSAFAVTLPKAKPEAVVAGFSSVAPTSTSGTVLPTDQAVSPKRASKKVSRSVVDQANILSQESEFRLTKALGQFQLERNVQVVVLTTASLRGYDIDKYSAAVSKQWGVAATKEKPGVLVVVAPNEKFVKIRVGPGLKEWMPDEVANHLISKFMIPAFAKSDWQGGVVRGSAGIIAVLGRDKPIQLAELNSSAAATPAPAVNNEAEKNVAAHSQSMANEVVTPSEAALTSKTAKASSGMASMLIWPMLLLLLAFAALALFWYRGRQVEDMTKGSSDVSEELKSAKANA